MMNVNRFFRVLVKRPVDTGQPVRQGFESGKNRLTSHTVVQLLNFMTTDRVIKQEREIEFPDVD